MARFTRRRLATTGAVAAALVFASAGSAGGPSPGDDPLLVSATYLGGNGEEWPGAAAMGSDGALWIAATSSSTEIPVTPVSPASSGDLDVAVLRLDPATRRVLSVAWAGGERQDKGSSADVAAAFAFDAAGNGYVAGHTFASDFPATSSNLPIGNDGSSAFVARVRSDGTGFEWVHVFGGIYYDVAGGLCVTPDGDPVVVGLTYSDDFPIDDPVDSALNLLGNLFVTRLAADGSGIVFSTQLDSMGAEDGGVIAALPGGGFLVAGNTDSTDLFTRGRVFGKEPAMPERQGFLAELDADGRLVRAASLGRTSIAAISVEATGTLLLAGTAFETDPRLTPPAHGDPGTDVGIGTGDALLLRLDATTWDVLGGAFFGGSGAESAVALTAGSDGVVWMSGTSGSTDLPVPGTVRHRLNGSQEDAFAAAFDPADLSLEFATYLGGTAWEWLPRVVPGAGASAWIVGSTGSFDFPLRDGVHARSDLSELFVAHALHGDADARPGPVAPFAADVVGSAVRLRWTASASAPDTCFVVERRELDAFERVAVVPADATEWIDRSVLPDRGYTYVVQAVNADGASPPTQAIRVLTPGSLEFRVDRGRSRRGRRGVPEPFRLAGRVETKAGGAALPDVRTTGMRIVLYAANGPNVVLDVGRDDPNWRSSRRRRRWAGTDMRLDFRPATGAFDLRVWNFSLSAQPGVPVAVRVEAGDHAATISTVWRSDRRNGILTP